MITKKLFDEVQFRLSAKKKNTGLKHSFLYRKFLQCASCSKPLVPESQKGHTYYRCHTRGCDTKCIREEIISECIAERLSKLSLSENEFTEIDAFICKEINDLSKKSEQLIQAKQLQLAQIDDRLLRLTDAYIDRVLDKDSFEDRKRKLLSEKLAIEAEQRALESGGGSYCARGKKLLELLKLLSDKETFNKPTELFPLAKEVYSNISVSPKSLDLQWCYPLAGLETTEQITSGVPHRGTCRTPPSKRGKRGSSTKSPRPHIHPARQDQIERWMEGIKEWL